MVISVSNSPCPSGFDGCIIGLLPSNINGLGLFLPPSSIISFAGEPIAEEVASKIYFACSAYLI